MSECCITFPGHVSRSTVCQITIEYMKYVLYYRGQFPLPLDQLKQILRTHKISLDGSSDLTVNGHEIFCDTPEHNDHVVTRSRAVVSRTKQKFIDAISNFDEFFNELSQILSTKSVKEIVLNLGPNMMNPKELYRITLPAVCSNPECALDYASFQKCKLQFFRDIMQSDLWKDLKSDSLLPISVMLLLENGVALNDYMEQKGFYALPRNCKQRTVHFMNQCYHADNLTSEMENFERMSVTDTPALSNVKAFGLWVKLKHNLKGFKSCSEVN